jgi:hypothetical protein
MIVEARQKKSERGNILGKTLVGFALIIKNVDTVQT